LGHAVAQLVEALRYKPEGCGFDSRWCHWNFSLTFPSGRTMALGLARSLKVMSIRNISWRVEEAGRKGLTYLPPSFADCHEIWEPQTRGTLRVCPGL